MSNLSSGNNITTVSTNDTTIKGANVNADNNLDITVGGNLDVESVQNVSASTNQDFAANLQGNVLNGQVAGGVSVGSGHSARAWVDDQTELTGGNSVNINVGGNLHNKGAVIANVDSAGNDGGNLNINVGGELTHENIQNFDDSIRTSAK